MLALACVQLRPLFGQIPGPFGRFTGSVGQIPVITHRVVHRAYSDRYRVARRLRHSVIDRPVSECDDCRTTNFDVRLTRYLSE
jgi:hypothetical protein